jgi:hypothetical protein
MALASAACAMVLFYYSLPTNSWNGVVPVSLRIVVIDRDSGAPIRGAEVEIIHPFDDERPRVKGTTDAEGVVDLRNMFYAGGTSSLTRETVHITFAPFAIQVLASEYDSFRAYLAANEQPSHIVVSSSPLNLKYPLMGPVKISMKKKSVGSDPVNPWAG